MNSGRVNKALLFIVGELGAVGPGELDQLLGVLYRGGYIDYENRKVNLPDGRRMVEYELPHIVLTDKGKQAMK